jgi:uncharacterized protein (DUF2236 family)
LRPTTEGERLLWRWATDWRLGHTGLSNGILQLMLPGLGAGVAEHSNFFDEPWDRITRSIGPIVASIRDEGTARAIRDLHKDIKGVDHKGRRYHALEPATFWWAHITIWRAIEQAGRRFSPGGMTEAERDAMYLAGMDWYRHYGVSDRGLPRTRKAYTKRFRQICAEELEMTPAAERAVDMALHGRVEGLLALPRWLANPLELGSTPAARLTSIGGLPAAVRDRFGIPWSTSDALQYRALVVAARESSRFVPQQVGRLPMRRHAGRSRIPAGVGAP